MSGTNNKKDPRLLQLESEQKQLLKGRGRWMKFFYMAMIGWVIFTATKVFDLTDLSKPPGADWLPYLATFVVSGGFLIWLMVLEALAKTDDQREVAIAMMVFAWIAELVMALGDTIFRQTMFDIMMPEALKWIVINMSVFIVMIYSLGAARFLWLDPTARQKHQLVKGIEIFMDARNEQITAIASEQADRIGKDMAMDDLLAALAQQTNRKDITADEGEIIISNAVADPDAKATITVKNSKKV